LLSACRKATGSLSKDLVGVVAHNTIKKIKATVVASLELDSTFKKPDKNQKKKWNW
jgi:hypothetical protein